MSEEEIVKKKKPRFLRTNTLELKRLGKGCRRKQKWRQPNGRDNKIRENIRGKRNKVKIGYKNKIEVRGIIKGRIPVTVENVKQASAVKQGDLVIIKKIGLKKRTEIEKIIRDKKAEILNQKKTGEKNESEK